MKEIGSGLSGRRRSLVRILRNPAVKTVVVEHRDRLMRFGFECVEAALASSGRNIIVIEPDEVVDDIVRDMTEVSISVCARLYGKRAEKNKAKKALEAIQE